MTIMRFYSIALLGIALFLLPTDTYTQDYPAQASELLQKAITTGQYAGITAAIAVDGQTRWIDSAGHCDEERTSPCNDDTVYRIASITKTMTAVAVLQLAERGALQLDEPIATYLPDYPKPAATQITARMLLHHTSGIPAYASAKETETQEQFNSLQEAYQVFQDRELLFTPGTAYAYTSYGYVVLGAVIEAAAEQTYGEYLQEHIWDIADMTQTGIEEFGTNYPAYSAFFIRNRKGKIKSATVNNLSNRLPAGGVYATVGDLLKFGQALMDGRLINQESLALMQQAPEVDRGQNNPYGMGAFLYGDNPQFGPVLGHSAEQTGVSGQLMLMPDKRIAIVVLSNTARAWKDAVQLSVQLFPLAAMAMEGTDEN